MVVHGTVRSSLPVAPHCLRCSAPPVDLGAEVQPAENDGDLLGDLPTADELIPLGD